MRIFLERGFVFVLLGALVIASVGCASQNRPLQLVSGAGPVYPAAARAEGVQGQVTIAYDVTIEGRVVNARVIQSEPAGVFDAAALQAVRSWRFNPKIVDGVPQMTKDQQSTVTFALGETAQYDQYD